MNSPSQAMKASRIDIWTSRNLAWDSTITKAYIANVDDPAGTVSGNSSALNDMKILNGNSGNLKISRVDKAKTIRVGYTFNPPQTIKAICLVRGDAYPSGSLKELDKKELVQIEYKTSDEVIYAPDPADMTRVFKDPLTHVVTLKGTTDKKRNFLEYTSIPFNDAKYAKNGQFGLYGNKKRQPGYGVYSPDYSIGHPKEAPHVVYSYFILEKEIKNCTQIVFVDKTAVDKVGTENYFLNISELMVFPENPLDFGGNPEDSYLSFVDNQAADNNVLQNGRMFSSSPLPPLVDNFSIVLNSSQQQMKNYIIKMKAIYPIKTIVIRELINNNPMWPAPSDIYEQKIYAPGETYGLLGSKFFNNSFTGFQNAVNSVRTQEFTTPFVKTTPNRIDVGNPLPYAPGGMDTPRMFAYKMYEQWRAREWFKATNTVKANKKADIKTRTTLAYEGAANINAYSEYVNEVDMFKAAGVAGAFTFNTSTYLYTNAYPAPRPAWTADGVLGNAIKPFLPGLIAPNRDGYVANLSSLYQPDKMAGVDSTGLLMGALAMAGKQNILDAFNRKKVLNAIDYYAMKNSNLPSGRTSIPLGLDIYGKPEFYAANSHQMLTGMYRFTRADLERCTVIVPDLSLIQQGDLLVNFDVEGEVHLGIVVGLTWASPPNYGENIRTQLSHNMLTEL